MDRDLYVAAATELGTVSVSSDAIAQIVGHAAVESYGVVALASPSWWGRLLPRGAAKGVRVERRDDGVGVDLHVVVEQGLNLAEVGTGVRARIAHEVERHTGLKVVEVEVARRPGAAVALMEIETIRTFARAALQNLEAHRQRIDDLNVYPVPDGDTGTNLTLTLRSVVEALEDSSAEGSADVAKALSRAALMGARGNSGRDLLPDRARLRRRPRPVGRRCRRPGSAARSAARAMPHTGR